MKSILLGALLLRVLNAQTLDDQISSPSPTASLSPIVLVHPIILSPSPASSSPPIALVDPIISSHSLSGAFPTVTPIANSSSRASPPVASGPIGKASFGAASPPATPELTLPLPPGETPIGKSPFGAAGPSPTRGSPLHILHGFTPILRPASSRLPVGTDDVILSTLSSHVSSAGGRFVIHPAASFSSSGAIGGAISRPGRVPFATLNSFPIPTPSNLGTARSRFGSPATPLAPGAIATPSATRVVPGFGIAAALNATSPSLSPSDQWGKFKGWRGGWDDEDAAGDYDGEDYDEDFANQKTGGNKGKGGNNNDDDDDDCPAWCKNYDSSPEDTNDEGPVVRQKDSKGLKDSKAPKKSPSRHRAARDNLGFDVDAALGLNRAPVSAPTPSPSPAAKGSFQWPQKKSSAIQGKGNNPTSAPYNSAYDPDYNDDEDDDLPDWLTSKEEKTVKGKCPTRCQNPGKGKGKGKGKSTTTAHATATTTSLTETGESTIASPPQPTTLITTTSSEDLPSVPIPSTAPSFTGPSLANTCPTPCDPFNPRNNKCDITTSCATTGGKNYYCACRAGYRADNYNSKDFKRQAKIPGQPYVYVEQGVVCGTLCGDQTCTEVLERPQCK